MDLGRYLLFTGRLTREEYQDLSLDQRLWGVQCLDRFPPDCLCPTHLDEVEDMSTVRELPFVEVLGRPQVADRVCARCGKTLEALVDECNEWHRDALEPISTYPTRSKFGRGVYERQQEKKLVAHYVVAGKKRDGSTLIGDGDTVILFEGSSALYIGLAIAAGHESVTVITPNAALIREYRDNPAVAQKFKLEIVGGAADVDPACGYCEHGGVYGPACQEQLTQAVTKEPPATVVVVTVAGLLPSVGPFDTGAVGCVKRDIITRALNSKVKAVIFATDYSKHIDGASGRFGAALFNPHEWKAMASNYESKIHVVTAPPPQIRAALAEGRLRAIQERPAGMAVTEQSGFAPEDVWYNHVAAELHKVLGSDVIRGECQPRFHEAYRVILNAAYYEKVRDVVELSFLVCIPGIELTEGVIRTSLPKMLGRDLDVNKFDIRIAHDADGATVRIRAPGDPGKKLQAFSESCQAPNSEQRAMFLNTMGTPRLPLRLRQGGKSTQVDLNVVG